MKKRHEGFLASTWIAGVALLLASSLAEAVVPLGETLDLSGQAEAAAVASDGLGLTVLAWSGEGGIHFQRIERGVLSGSSVQAAPHGRPWRFDLNLDSRGIATLASYEFDLFPGVPLPPFTALYRVATAPGIVESGGEFQLATETRLAGFDSGATVLLDFGGPFMFGGFSLLEFDPVGVRQPGRIGVEGPFVALPPFRDVAVNGNGEILVVWSGASCVDQICRFDGLFSKILDRDGRVLAGPTQLAPAAAGVSAAPLPDGRFLVAWSEPGDLETGRRAPLAIHVRTVTSTALGPTRPVKAELSGQTSWLPSGTGPDLAVDPLGHVLVTWQEQDDPEDETWRLLVQEFDPDSGPVGFRFRLSSSVGLRLNANAAAGVVAEAPGRFLVTWLERAGDTSSLLGQRFVVEKGDRCLPSESSLCLLGGRFEVSGRFQRPSGGLSPIRFETLGDASGIGSFLRTGNSELLLKMLDGSGVNGHFWVFLGGLSDVAFELTVRDLVSDSVRTYRNPRGRLASFGDTRAFSAVSGASEGAGVQGTAALGAQAISAPEGREAIAENVVPLGADGTPGCVPGHERLCLQGGRFGLTLQWRDRRGREGSGIARPVSGDSGAFWFFRRDNPEVLVKVLDGRAVNGRFWVFYASATDVEFTLTVTDTETLETRVYENPQGTFASRADVRAFLP